MARSLLAVSGVLAVILAGCGSDYRGAGDGSATQAPQFDVACASSLPDADALDGPLVLGFMLDGPAELIVMDAQVEVEPDGSALSITIDEPERCGPAQHFDPIALNDDGTFSVNDVALRFPHGISSADDAEATVSLEGGFCTSVGSLQGSYSGTALTPDEKSVDGKWFIARVTDPDALQPTCATQSE